VVLPAEEAAAATPELAPEKGDKVPEKLVAEPA